ncbi:TPM domain-containing protein [uncultured Methylovirgula sp.]|uniref:TPM domain-containing protein n=1 Tax=uncultured Methylovirgula sp. TaxID=1285960 RepID=UPI00345ABC02
MLSADDRTRISGAIRAAEAKTSGEIVCVLAESSSQPGALPILLAAIVALALPWLLVAYTQFAVERILLVQSLVFLLLAILLLLPPVYIALIPRRARRAAAHRLAAEQFVIRGIARKKDRNGILIFVSLAERYARIMADEGIAARATQAQWQAAIDTLVTHMRQGRIADGFVGAIDACADVLAAHFPAAPARQDELPDRIYVI